MTTRSSCAALLVVVSALFACKKSAPSGEPAPGAASAAVPGGVVFTKKVPPAGTKRVEEYSSDMAFDIEAKQGGHTIRRVAVKKVERSKRRVEVLSVSDTAMMKIRVEYLEAYSGESQGNREPTKVPTAVSGKTYVAEASGGKILVTRDGGGTATSREKKIVSKDFDNLGKPDRMSSFIPDRPLVPEEKLAVSPEMVRDVFMGSDDDEVKVEQAEFKFRSTAPKGDKTVGTFDAIVKVTGDSKKEDMSMAMDFAGKITMDTATSWPYELSLKGPITVKGKSRGIVIDGTGNASLSMVATYE